MDENGTTTTTTETARAQHVSFYGVAHNRYICELRDIALIVDSADTKLSTVYIDLGCTTMEAQVYRQVADKLRVQLGWVDPWETP